MTNQKQLIKAINDLTKALNKNTDAIKENTELSKRDINTIEGGTPDDLKSWYDNQPNNLTLEEIRNYSIIQNELMKNSMTYKEPSEPMSESKSINSEDIKNMDTTLLSPDEVAEYNKAYYSK